MNEINSGKKRQADPNGWSDFVEIIVKKINEMGIDETYKKSLIDNIENNRVWRIIFSYYSACNKTSENPYEATLNEFAEFLEDDFKEKSKPMTKFGQTRRIFSTPTKHAEHPSGPSNTIDRHAPVEPDVLDKILGGVGNIKTNSPLISNTEIKTILANIGMRINEIDKTLKSTKEKAQLTHEKKNKLEIELDKLKTHFTRLYNYYEYKKEFIKLKNGKPEHTIMDALIIIKNVFQRALCPRNRGEQYSTDNSIDSSHHESPKVFVPQSLLPLLKRPRRDRASFEQLLKEAEEREGISSETDSMSGLSSYPGLTPGPSFEANLTDSQIAGLDTQDVQGGLGLDTQGGGKKRKTKKKKRRKKRTRKNRKRRKTKKKKRRKKRTRRKR